MNNINLLTIFLTGLFTGGLTCMAVQGGLLATTIAQREEERLKEKTKKIGNAFPILVFIAAKLIAYTILGFLLGWFGSLFQLSLPIQFLMQFLVALFMIGTALNILNVHPIFRYFALQPPRFLTRLVRKQSKSKDVFAPAILGAFTIFIPCGTTQAMMALAIASGSPIFGAAILLSFMIGTAPLFFILGYFTTKLSEAHHGRFMKFAAFAILILAAFNLNNSLLLAGAGIAFPINNSNHSQNTAPVSTEATIHISSTGYTPNIINLKSNSSVTLNLINKDAFTCASAFTIPTLGIQKIVQVGQTAQIKFTTPKEPTQIKFSCSMGMYNGFINVI